MCRKTDLFYWIENLDRHRYSNSHKSIFHAPQFCIRMHDKSLIEFPLEKGLTRFDYCPLRCTICLMGILKKDAKAGPCVTHVFHRDCIDKWSLYCMEKDQVASCPNCLQQYKS